MRDIVYAAKKTMGKLGTDNLLDRMSFISSENFQTYREGVISILQERENITDEFWKIESQVNYHLDDINNNSKLVTLYSKYGDEIDHSYLKVFYEEEIHEKIREFIDKNLFKSIDFIFVGKFNYASAMNHAFSGLPIQNFPETNQELTCLTFYGKKTKDSQWEFWDTMSQLKFLQ